MDRVTRCPRSLGLALLFLGLPVPLGAEDFYIDLTQGSDYREDYDPVARTWGAGGAKCFGSFQASQSGANSA